IFHQKLAPDFTGLGHSKAVKKRRDALECSDQLGWIVRPNHAATGREHQWFDHARVGHLLGKRKRIIKDRTSYEALHRHAMLMQTLSHTVFVAGGRHRLNGIVWELQRRRQLCRENGGRIIHAKNSMDWMGVSVLDHRLRG